MKHRRRNRDSSGIEEDFAYCVQFEDIDIHKKCPTFTKVVTSKEVHLSTLQKLQDETELVLSSLIERRIYLQASISGTALPCHFQPNVKSLVVKSNPEKPLTLIIAQKATEEDADIQVESANGVVGPGRPWKRMKIDTSQLPLSKPNGVGPWGANNNKNDSHRTSSCALSPTLFHDQNKQSYEIPNKFWSLMEPYCAEINDDQIKTLESMIKRYDEDSDTLGGPSDAKCKTRARAGGKSGKSGKGAKKASKSSNNTLDTICSAMKEPVTESSLFGNLAKCIAENIFEETVTHALTENVPRGKLRGDANKGSIATRCKQANKAMAKSLHVSNSYRPEKSIRQLLQEVVAAGDTDFPGVSVKCEVKEERDDSGDEDGCDADVFEAGMAEMKSECDVEDGDVDEIGRELKRDGLELLTVGETNRATLKNLVKAARKDMVVQEVRRRLAIADADVMEAYTKLESYRQQRKIPLKRDRDLAWKTLKDRRKILREMEQQLHHHHH